jgi:SynChlorMet cassette protein ScmC
MLAARHDHAYTLALSSGDTWGIGPCEGADAGVVAWVDEFASYLGLERATEIPARSIRFGRVLSENGRYLDTYAGFVPSLQGFLPPHGWQVCGRAGAILMRHPTSRDIFCGLYRHHAPITDQMRYALSPVIDESIAEGGLPLHGALVEKRGVGVILTGRSGAGKTTCCRRLPPSWRVHGDDLALVVRDNAGGFAAHPLPTWSAVRSGQIQWPCRANRAVPLRALFIIMQAAQDRIEPLTKAKGAVLIETAGVEALAPLNRLRIRQMSPLRKSIFNNAATLGASVPAFRLYVSLGGCFWEKIEAVIDQLAQGSAGHRDFGERAVEIPAPGADGISREGRAA